MPQDRDPHEIDAYIQSLFPPDDALTKALESSRDWNLPEINVSPNEGRLLYVIARMVSPRRILEIGTLGGFSAINLARGLQPGGKLISLEYEPRHAEVARANIERAGLSDRVEVRVGAALDTLPHLEGSPDAPFDLIFIDADKPNYPAYLDWAIRLSRPGTVILADNLIRGGDVIDPPRDNEAAQAISGFNRTLSTHPRLEAVILPLIRERIDGLGIAIVKS